MSRSRFWMAGRRTNCCSHCENWPGHYLVRGSPLWSLTMRLLVTGGAGFIGANFVHSTVREHPDDDVTVLDALTYAGRRESLADVEDAIRLVVGDITDAGLVSRLVAESDAVVHFAAESHVDNALDEPETFL